MKRFLLLICFNSFISMPFILGQDLDSILDKMNTRNDPIYVLSTFNSTRLVLGQSVEIPVEKDLTFIISHRFGNIKGGFYDLFGMDQAYNRLGLEYGINDRVGLSFGRNNFEKIYDGALKLKLIRQQHGLGKIPVSVTFYSGVFINTVKWDDPQRDNLFSSRLSYINQFIFARKFNKKISFQVTPSLVHKNLVRRNMDQNNTIALGMGGKYQFARKISFNAEYFWIVYDQNSNDLTNSLSLGFDFETGGHVFQLNVSNSYGSTEDYFIAQPNGDWGEGDIFLGFNIYRVFLLSEKRKNIY